jgi:shikimate dehydrogenase
MIRLGLIGFPLEHSLSPVLHSAALQACGLQGTYSLFPIKREDTRGLNTLLNQVRTGELNGLNITIPHKQNIIRFLDELTPLARTVGAVNTIYLKDGNLIGDNTDALGFLNDLKNIYQESKALEWKKAGGIDKFALILGAGGAARAVAYTLMNTGWTITVAARRIEQAKDLANSHLNVSQFDRFHITPILSTVHLIVNTIPLGMYPKINASPWIEGLEFPKNAVLYDLIYNPPETFLVQQARAAGLHAITGTGMFVEQAALAFKLWTGYDIPRSIMFEAIKISVSTHYS